MRKNPLTQQEKDVAATLRTIRYYLHISQTEFAKLCRIRRESLVKYESGIVPIQRKQLALIRAGYSCIVEDRAMANEYVTDLFHSATKGGAA